MTCASTTSTTGPATNTATGVTLTADGIAPTGAYSVWLNGAFLGSGSAAGAQTQTFAFPPGAVVTGQDNVIAVLVENTGNPEGPSGEKVGLYDASLVGSSAAISWRLMGDPGGSTLQDPVRGIMNESGLFGSDNGWDLPGYPDAAWTNVTLPDSWSARGVPAGIGWYRTAFSLHLPPSGYVPIDVQIDVQIGGAWPGAGTADYRAFIYVNGWLIGRYVNNVGPQHQFYVPPGWRVSPAGTVAVGTVAPGSSAATTFTVTASASGLSAYLFEQNVTLESGKTIEAVTLPNLGSVAGYNPALHVFALTVGG